MVWSFRIMCPLDLVNHLLHLLVFRRAGKGGNALFLIGQKYLQKPGFLVSRLDRFAECHERFRLVTKPAEEAGGLVDGNAILKTLQLYRIRMSSLGSAAVLDQVRMQYQPGLIIGMELEMTLY